MKNITKYLLLTYFISMLFSSSSYSLNVDSVKIPEDRYLLEEARKTWDLKKENLKTEISLLKRFKIELNNYKATLTEFDPKTQILLEQLKDNIEHKKNIQKTLFELSSWLQPFEYFYIESDEYENNETIFRLRSELNRRLSTIAANIENIIDNEGLFVFRKSNVDLKKINELYQKLILINFQKIADSSKIEINNTIVKIEKAITDNENDLDKINVIISIIYQAQSEKIDMNIWAIMLGLPLFYVTIITLFISQLCFTKKSMNPLRIIIQMNL